MRSIMNACLSCGIAFLPLMAGGAEAPVPAAPVAPEPPKSQGLSLTVGETSIKFYGFVRLDMHYDDSHPNNTQLISCIKSEDKNAAAALPGVAEMPNSADFTMSARLTRFGVDVTSPTIAMLGDARASAKIEIDFLANGGSEAVSISRAVPRMRLAYLKLAWDDFSILAGQGWDVFSPLNPTVNGEFVMWGAGNLGDRRPMIMADYHPAVAGGTLILQGEVGLTGAVDNQNLDVGAVTTTVRDGEASAVPTFMARIAYKHPHLWVEKKTFEVGVWGDFAKEHLDRLPAGYTENRFTSTGFGLDVTLPLHDLVDIRGEVWGGKNLDDVRGGILQGISNVDGGTEVRSRGYWIEAAVKPLDWYTLHLGTSRDNPFNHDIAAPVAATNAPAGAVDNHVFYVGNRFNLGGGLLLGFDYLHWTTQWRGDLANGTDNRFSVVAQLSF